MKLTTHLYTPSAAKSGSRITPDIKYDTVMDEFVPTTHVPRDIRFHLETNKVYSNKV